MKYLLFVALLVGLATMAQAGACILHADPGGSHYDEWYLIVVSSTEHLSLLEEELNTTFSVEYVPSCGYLLTGISPSIESCEKAVSFVDNKYYVIGILDYVE